MHIMTLESLNAKIEAAETILECQRILQNTGHNIVTEILKTSQNFVEWDHYPENDVMDHATGAQYYYHAHADKNRIFSENGHFHILMKNEKLTSNQEPEGQTPPSENLNGSLTVYEKQNDLKKSEAPKSEKEHSRSKTKPVEAPCAENDILPLTHIIAISMDEYGAPQGLFTVNHWVTGGIFETWEPTKNLLNNFYIDHAQPSLVVNQWMNAMMVLFYDDIIALLKSRDDVIDQHDNTFLENRDFDILSHKPISVTDKLLELQNLAQNLESAA